MTLTDKTRSLQEKLRRQLADLNAEIGSYPGPITGCDAQFNHLLEERARLNAELTKLSATGGNGKNENTGP